MKKISLLTVFTLALALHSCSTCYECTTDVELTDGNGNVIDTTENFEEFCTADPAEVESRESEGAVCRVQ
jgi:hypothetical protein